MQLKRKLEKKDLKTISKVFKESLPKLNWSPTPELDLEILMSKAIQKNRVFINGNPQHLIKEDELIVLQELIKRRADKEPIAYLLERKHFYNYDFYVNKDVLIPRPETELIVEEALHYILNNPVRTITDIGTGSGCIIITIAKELQKHCLKKRHIFKAFDTSEEALKIARKNYLQHFPQKEISINFLKSNLLQGFDDKIDVLISNLPYIPEKEYETLDDNVINFEPRTALVGGEKGSELIKELLIQSASKLSKKSLILLEINHDQGSYIIQIAKELFPKSKIDIIKDYANFDRIIRIENN